MQKKEMSLLNLISVCWLIFGLIVFIPSTSPAEEFECFHCYSGIGSLYHLDYELPQTVRWEFRGIIKCKSEKMFLNNATSHAIGIIHGSDTEKEGYFEIILKDQDGDMIVARGPQKGMDYQDGLKYGTGKYQKYKDIKMTLTREKTIPPEGMLEDLKKYLEKQRPLEMTYSRPFDRCNLWKGTVELPPK